MRKSPWPPERFARFLGMVRRAERQLGLAVRAGQADGTIAKKGQSFGGRHAGVTGMTPKKLSDIGTTSSEMVGNPRTVGLYPLADNGTDQDFERALDACKAEGNVSRAASISGRCI